MARTARIKRTANGVAYYHLISRTNGKRFLFSNSGLKTELVEALKRAAAFSGIVIEAYTAMDNHFHVVCRVSRSDDLIDENVLYARIAALKGKERARRIFDRWMEMRSAGASDAVDKEQDRLRERMNDISEFIKTFKETFNVWYKRHGAYSGSIWDGRFKSTLIEDGKYLAVCKRYVLLNAVRARMVSQIKDYQWAWMREDSALGSVPEGAGARRVSQISGGKVFGGLEFVAAAIGEFRERFRSHMVAARQVGCLGWATHGYKLAAGD